MTEIATNLALVRRFVKVNDDEAWSALHTATKLLSRRPEQLVIELIDDARAAELNEERNLVARVSHCAKRTTRERVLATRLVRLAGFRNH